MPFCTGPTCRTPAVLVPALPVDLHAVLAFAPLALPAIRGPAQPVELPVFLLPDLNVELYATLYLRYLYNFLSFLQLP